MLLILLTVGVVSANIGGVTTPIFLQSIDTSPETVEKGGNVVDIEVFGESLCPDTTRFLRNHLLNLWKNYGNSGRINVTYHPFGITRSTGCTPLGNGDYECNCQHGAKECLLNSLQACVIKALPRTEDYLETVICIQQKYELFNALAQCVENATFTKKVILDSKKLEACATSAEGRSLMAAHGVRQHLVAPELEWVPWILINGKRDKAAEHSIWQELCNGFLKPKPQECSKKLY